MQMCGQTSYQLVEEENTCAGKTGKLAQFVCGRWKAHEAECGLRGKNWKNLRQELFSGKKNKRSMYTASVDKGLWYYIPWSHIYLHRKHPQQSHFLDHNLNNIVTFSDVPQGL